MKTLMLNLLFLRKANLYLLMKKEKEYHDNVLGLAFRLNERINDLEARLEKLSDNRNN